MASPAINGGRFSFPRASRARGFASKPSPRPLALAAQCVSNLLQAEITAFHAEHFSTTSVQHFSAEYLQPTASSDDEYYDANNEYDIGEEDADDLGYYSDGVKRTLTDEQIAIFRHSELEQQRRAREKAASKRSSGDETEMEAVPLEQTKTTPHDHASSDEDGEIASDTPKSRPQASKKKKKRNKKKAKPQADSLQRGDPGWFKKTVKPDLRKRTWDKVEAGMDRLDYEDSPPDATGSPAGPAAQRRKISYDD